MMMVDSPPPVFREPAQSQDRRSHSALRSVSPSSRRRIRPAASSSFIHVEPEWLVFPPPHYGRCLQNTITVYNFSHEPCAWKLKSQNPQRYIAKPNCSLVAPRSAVCIRVFLRPSSPATGEEGEGEKTTGNYTAAGGGTCADRFRLQLKFISETDVSSVGVLAAGKTRTTAECRALWEAIPSPVVHEKDLLAYLTPHDPSPKAMLSVFPVSQFEEELTRRGSVPSPARRPRSLSIQHSREANPSAETGKLLNWEADDTDSEEGAVPGKGKAPEVSSLTLWWRSWTRLRGFLCVLSILLFAFYGVGAYTRKFQQQQHQQHNDEELFDDQ